MKKILAWIKKNILGLEPPRRSRKKPGGKVRKYALKKVSIRTKKQPLQKKKQLPQKPLKQVLKPVKQKVLKPIAPIKNFKKNSDQLLKVSESYLKKPPVPKTPKKTAVAIDPAPVPVKPAGVKVGVITHFFPNVSAAIIKVTRGKITSGEQLHFKGVSTDFKIIVKSMQMNRLPIETALKGQEIGIQVPDRVREGDEVFKVSLKKKKSAS